MSSTKLSTECLNAEPFTWGPQCLPCVESSNVLLDEVLTKACGPPILLPGSGVQAFVGLRLVSVDNRVLPPNKLMRVSERRRFYANSNPAHRRLSHLTRALSMHLTKARPVLCR